MEADKLDRANRRTAILLGIGLALFPVHNRWLAETVSAAGEAILFLPVFGTLIWVLVTLYFIRDNYRALDHGDLKILLEHGDNFFIALLAREDMNIYWDRLNRLHKTIESLFRGILKAWDGNLAY